MASLDNAYKFLQDKNIGKFTNSDSSVLRDGDISIKPNNILNNWRKGDDPEIQQIMKEEEEHVVERVESFSTDQKWRLTAVHQVPKFGD